MGHLGVSSQGVFRLKAVLQTELKRSKCGSPGRSGLPGITATTRFFRIIRILRRNPVMLTGEKFLRVRVWPSDSA